MRERQCYVCDFCGRKYLTKRLCEKHEEICKHNPINFYPCNYCKHFKKYSISSEPDESSFTWEFIPSYCKAKEEYMQSAKAFVKNKGNPVVNDYKETFEEIYKEPIVKYPNVCTYFEHKDMSFFSKYVFDRFIKRFPYLRNKVNLIDITEQK